MTGNYSRYMGGHGYMNPFTTSFKLAWNGRRAFSLYPGVSDTGLYVRLPDATKLPLGGPYFTVSNGGTPDFDIQDFDGAVIHTLANASAVMIFLLVQGTAAGTWITFEIGAL